MASPQPKLFNDQKTSPSPYPFFEDLYGSFYGGRCLCHYWGISLPNMGKSGNSGQWGFSGHYFHFYQSYPDQVVKRFSFNFMMESSTMKVEVMRNVTTISTYFGCDRWLIWSRASVQKAVAVAKRNQAELILIHIVDTRAFQNVSSFDSAMVEQVTENAKTTMEGYVDQAKKAGLEKSVSVLSTARQKQSSPATSPKLRILISLWLGLQG